MPSGSDTPSSSGAPGSTDDLAARARHGDDRSFGRLFRRVAPAVYAFACARIDWRWQDAEDAVAETWVRAWKKFDSYDPSRSFRSWIFGFASRVVMEIQRRVAREPGTSPKPQFDPAEVPAEATSVSRRVARDEANRAFAEWVRTLSDYEREVLILRGLQGWSHNQVAAALGRTVTGVKECWRRLLTKVRDRGTPVSLVGDYEDERSSDDPQGP